MKKKMFMYAVLVLAMAISMTAFVSPTGGEGYQIYIDDKLILEQFGSEMKQVKNLQLDQSHKKSELKVKFYHCGMAGRSRTLELRTPGKQVIKSWQFANEEGKNFAIRVRVEEILDLQKRAGAGTLHLFYTSQEAPDGRFLAGITIGGKSVAKR